MSTSVDDIKKAHVAVAHAMYAARDLSRLSAAMVEAIRNGDPLSPYMPNH